MNTSWTNALFCVWFVFAGGLGAKWSVTYTPTDICALEGSSVNMSCSYTYPSGLIVEQAFWINQDSVNPVDLSQFETYRHRVTVDCGDKSSRCSLQMTKITKADAQYQYYCRITTDVDGQKWIGRPGISLHVTGKSNTFVSLKVMNTMIVYTHMNTHSEHFC